MKKLLFIVTIVIMSACSSFRYGSTLTPINDYQPKDKKTDSMTWYNTLLPLVAFVVSVKLICPECSPFGIR